MLMIIIFALIRHSGFNSNTFEEFTIDVTFTALLHYLPLTPSELSLEMCENVSMAIFSSINGFAIVSKW